MSVETQALIFASRQSALGHVISYVRRVFHCARDDTKVMPLGSVVYLSGAHNKKRASESLSASGLGYSRIGRHGSGSLTFIHGVWCHSLGKAVSGRGRRVVVGVPLVVQIPWTGSKGRTATTFAVELWLERQMQEVAGQSLTQIQSRSSE